MGVYGEEEPLLAAENNRFWAYVSAKQNVRRQKLS